MLLIFFRIFLLIVTVQFKYVIIFITLFFIVSEEINPSLFDSLFLSLLDQNIVFILNIISHTQYFYLLSQFRGALCNFCPSMR